MAHFCKSIPGQRGDFVFIEITGETERMVQAVLKSGAYANGEELFAALMRRFASAPVAGEDCIPRTDDFELDDVLQLNLEAGQVGWLTEAWEDEDVLAEAVCLPYGPVSLGTIHMAMAAIPGILGSNDRLRGREDDG